MPPRNIIIRRLLIAVVIGALVGVAVSEVPFIFLRETARPPQEIMLTIPRGTSEQVARGEQPPSIPANMTFVVGDTLVVENHDSVDHKLGPLWIPANTNASLPLGEEASLAFECTFQPGNYLGLDVRQPLTASTRLFAILYVGIPMAILIALYSFAMPARKKEVVSA